MGRASDMLRRRLVARGYEVRDLSDRLDPRRQKTASAAEAAAAAKAAGASVALAGTAESQPAPDERLQSYHPMRACVTATATWVASGEVLATVTAQASAVDLVPVTAGAKALDNAGELAADQLAAALSRRFRERTEMALTVAGLDAWERLRRFVGELRGLPGVAGAAVVGLAPGEARLRVFAEKLSPEELVALLMRLPGYSFEVRSLDADDHVIELETSGGN